MAAFTKMNICNTTAETAQANWAFELEMYKLIH